MKRFFALLLVFLCFLSSCTSSPVSSNTEATSELLSNKVTEPVSEVTVEQDDTVFVLDGRYKIIRSDESTDAVEAARYIRAAIEAICGERLDLETDWVKRGEEIKPGEFEILVGATNREESAELFSTLKRGDWEYRVEEGRIIVCGGGAESTLDAAIAFCNDVLGYNGENLDEKSVIELNSGITRSYVQTYPITSVLLNGKSITDYVLAIPSINSANREIADYFNDLLSENAGFQLTVKSIDSISGGELYIELGKKKNELSPYKYLVSGENGILSFSGDTKSLPEAIKRYLSVGLAAGQGEIVLELPSEPMIGYGGQQNGLVIANESREAIADGVEYRLLKYLDKDGKPVNAHVLVVEPGKAQIINGTPNGGTDLYNVKATTVDAAKAAEKQGYRVLAGVNADFFRISSDYSPQGPCIKNGEILSIDTERPYFGVTKDGKFVIEEANTLKKESDNLLEALGGRYILLKNGRIHQIGYDEEFGYTRHPRTAVGFDKDGRLYLLVVDGRQPSLSNGASLTDLAIIMLELGATDALNLDGGGSSTFILENGDGFKTMNSPSDGSLRKVYNSLLVVLK